MSGRLIKITPEGVTSVSVISHSGTPTWEELNKAIGGYIERIRVRYEGKVRDAYVDEEGLPKNLAMNTMAMDIAIDPHYLVGPIVIWVPDPRTKKDVQSSTSSE